MFRHWKARNKTNPVFFITNWVLTVFENRRNIESLIFVDLNSTINDSIFCDYWIIISLVSKLLEALFTKWNFNELEDTFKDFRFGFPALPILSKNLILY